MNKKRVIDESVNANSDTNSDAEQSPHDEISDSVSAARNDPAKICGAKSKNSSDGVCHNWKGFRTSHIGTGRCWIHDGRRPYRVVPTTTEARSVNEDGESDVPIRALIVPERSHRQRANVPITPALITRASQLVADTDLLKLDGEIALCKAKLEAVASGNILGEDDESMASIAAINSLSLTISKLAKTKSDIELSRKYLVKLESVQNWINTLGRICEKYIPPSSLDAFSTELKESLSILDG